MSPKIKIPVNSTRYFVIFSLSSRYPLIKQRPLIMLGAIKLIRTGVDKSRRQPAVVVVPAGQQKGVLVSGVIVYVLLCLFRSNKPPRPSRAKVAGSGTTDMGICIDVVSE